MLTSQELHFSFLSKIARPGPQQTRLGLAFVVGATQQQEIISLNKPAIFL